MKKDLKRLAAVIDKTNKSLTKARLGNNYKIREYFEHENKGMLIMPLRYFIDVLGACRHKALPLSFMQARVFCIATGRQIFGIGKASLNGFLAPFVQGSAHCWPR